MDDCRIPVSYTHLDVYKRQLRQDAVMTDLKVKDILDWGSKDRNITEFEKNYV